MIHGQQNIKKKKNHVQIFWTTRYPWFDPSQGQDILFHLRSVQTGGEVTQPIIQRVQVTFPKGQATGKRN
jgi:hypothetical protein